MATRCAAERQCGKHWVRALGLGRGVLWLVLGVAAGSASGQEVSTGAYRARWQQGGVDLLTPGGERLAWWPVGAAGADADPATPACPAPDRTPGTPACVVVAGVTEWRWHFAFSSPCPIAEQVETATFLADRVEWQVRVRWRGPAPRLARLVYGGRLQAGCVDLEGLWEKRAAGNDSAPWLPAPVPGLFTEPGAFLYRRSVNALSGKVELLLGGADDEDVCLINGQEVGRTPLDRATSSWEKPRRYRVPASVLNRQDGALIEVRVSNSDGPGGLWRGPCVLGPQAALAGTAGNAGWILAAGQGSDLQHWCADGAPRALPGQFTVSLTSQDRTRELVPGNVTTGGRFQIPPYLVAVDSPHGWWGVGTLDLPRAEDGLRVEWRGSTFACPFLLATEAPGVAGSWTIGPRVALFVGRSRQDILDGYLAAVPVPPRTAWETWWSGPEYCTWGDQVYSGRLQGVSDLATLTAANVELWLAALAKQRIDPAIVTLDAGWWQLPPQVVSRLHDQGRHVLLWTQPHWAPLGVREIADNPQWTMHDSTGAPLRFDATNGLLDFTVPGAREYVARQMRAYVAQDGWNADGIKLDFAYTTAPVWAVHGDPAWGAGEQYRARALRFVYETITTARPGALVTGSNTNPLFGRVQDVCRLNEDWGADPQTFRRRAATVLAFGERAECDDWLAYEHYLPAQAVERPIWGPLTLMSSLYRADRNNVPVPLSPAWASRLSALCALARQVPLQREDSCTYDPPRQVARRTAPDGTVVAEALPLHGQGPELKALWVRTGTRLLLASIADGSVDVPVNEHVTEVTAVFDEGRRQAVEFTMQAAAVRIAVADAGGPVSYYEIALAGREAKE
jgi:hypothetical protein